LTFAEVYASNIPARAEQLAEEIAAVEPDLIALQEVTLWNILDPNGSPVVYDQLELLKSALDAKGQHYRVLVVQPLTDILLPISDLFTARFTDHNAILVRSDLPPGHLDIVGTESHLYENQLFFTLPAPFDTTIPLPNGWMAVDVKIRGARFKFVNTHLLSPVPAAVSPDAFDATSQLQQAQAYELLDALSATSLPVILAGDFNSDAEVPQHTPDNTPTVGIISTSGYQDAWHYLNPEDAGYTWPLFFEDQLSIYPTSPFERIDLIFSRGPVPLAVERTGTSPGETGVFASDHVGVVADFALQNHRPEVPRGKK
jgi:endonuclease/exonuclease/phosphatase family metal-dependent hydrolase